jgi:hypothetical protein
MINQSRLSSINSIPASRGAQDERKHTDNMFSPLGSGQDVASEASALAGGIPINNGAALAGANSFSQLLELSKIEKPEVQPVKRERAEKQTVEEPKAAKDPEKKEKTDNGIQRTTRKTKEKKSDTADSEQVLSQLLTAQQTVSKVNPSDNPKQKVEQTPDTAKVQTQPSLNKLTDAVIRQTVADESVTPAVKELTAGVTQKQKSEGPQSLNDVMKALGDKLGHLSEMKEKGNVTEVVENVQPEIRLNTKGDQFKDIASKFDDVKFEFTPNTESSQPSAQRLSGLTPKDAQISETMKKIPELDLSHNDLAIRDLLSQQALQEQALEKLTLDRLDQLSNLKNSQLDRLQMQDLQSAKTLKDMMLRDAQAASQPQWLSFRDLSPDQQAMLDAMSSGYQPLNGNPNNASQSNQTGPQISSRLANPTDSSGQMNLTRDAVTGIQSLPSMAQEQFGGTNSRQNSSAQSSPQGNDSTAIGTVGAARDAQNKVKGGNIEIDGKEDPKTRESERSREIARAAALRTQSIASELAAKGGGTAKVQIKDSQLGVVELRINMSDNNKVNVELIANNERIKNELEKQSEELKNGLEKHKVVLEGVSFATDTKLGDTSSQNSSQSDNSRANQQQQQQQNFSSFSQNGGNAQQQSFGGGERFFEGPRTPLTGQTGTSESARKNYSGKNDAQTNVQRNANGSLKVTA